MVVVDDEEDLLVPAEVSSSVLTFFEDEEEFLVDISNNSFASSRVGLEDILIPLAFNLKKKKIKLL